MSMLAVTASAVVQASPSPAPIVETVKTVVQTVPVTPEWFTQLVTFAEFVVPAWIASVAHDIVKSRVLRLQTDAYDWLNSALLFGYSFVITAAVLLLQHNLNLSSPDTAGAAFLTVVGAASGRYALLKIRQRLTSPPPAPVL